jgi:hypothetical protein
MGFNPQVHEQPVRLYGYQGDLRNKKAHIIVNRQQIHPGSNDLGFFWNGTEYECIISEFDLAWGNASPGQGLGRNFLPTLLNKYGEIIVREKARQLQDKFGECTITETQNGTIRTLRLAFAAHQQVQHVRR